SGLEVTAVGNLGYGYSFQHVAGKTKNGNTMDVTLRVTDVYRKSGDKWLIVHEHVSVPVDLDSGKADLQSKQ
ncbi:MAG: nuclear transport factor 2 family protein, partial [Acidobacteria bacterium]|nr:nuclear transport factor 2 family protein [Acidobacteriota bacterium]